MDIWTSTSSVAAACAFAAAAGLNPFVPLLVLALTAGAQLFVLSTEMAWLASPWWALGIGGLLIVQLILDKLPRLRGERAWGVAQLLASALTGAAAFGSVYPAVWSAGAVIAMGIQCYKQVFLNLLPSQRLVIALSLFSALVDLMAMILTLIGILCPLVAGPCFVVAVLLFRKIHCLLRRGEPVRVAATPIPEAAISRAPLESP